MEIPPLGAEFSADGQTGRAKIIVSFRSFANAPKMSGIVRPCLHAPYGGYRNNFTCNNDEH